MYTNIPTYFPGDILKLRLKFQHETNLSDVWANFEKEEEVTALTHFRFTARLSDHNDLRLLDRAGAQMISEAILEAPVSKERPLPGVYELSEVRGLPYGEDRRESSVIAFEVPRGVRFQIAAPLADRPPTVTHWELGWEAQPREPEASA